MASKNKIGEAYVEITADAKEYYETAERVRAESVRLADETRRSSKEASDSVEKGVQSQIGQFTGLIGAVTSVIGTFAVFLTIGKKVGQLFSDNASAAEKFKSSLSMTDPLQDIRKLQEEIDKINTGLSFENGGFLERVGGRINLLLEGQNVLFSQARKKQEELAASVDAIRGQLAGAEAEAERKREAAERLEIEREIEATYERASRKALETESEIGRIQIESTIEQDRVRERLAQVQDERLRAALENELRYIQEAADFKLEQIRKTEAERARIEEERRREREQRESESAKRQAETLAKAFEGALDRVEQRARAANGGIQSTLAGIQRTLAEINTKVARSGGTI